MPTSTLLPDGTVSQTCTVAGAGSVHAALSDSSDASFILRFGSGRQARVSLGTVALPAGAVTKTVAITLRSLGGATAVLLYPDGTFITIQGDVAPGAFTTYAGTPQAITLSQAQIDGLLVDVDLWGSGGEVAEISATLAYALVPTVAVSAPTGTVTTTTQPTVTWAHTPGTDGGPQVAYQVKIFNAAQYGAGGFNPATSIADYDSGIVASAASSVATGTLTSPTTFRAYVATAQSINGANHWSDWAFSAFSTNVPGPAISTIVVVPDSTLGRHRLTVTRNTGTLNWTFVEVQRSNDGGVTWSPVRGAAAAAPPGDVWIGYDYEAPNGVSVVYRARGKTSLITGAWLSSSSATWSSASTWLKDLVSTANSQTVRARVIPDVGRGRAVSVLYPVGASAPVVVGDVQRLRSGTLEVVTVTAAQATLLRTLLAANQTLLLQPPAAHDVAAMYLSIAGDVAELRPLRPATAAHRVWSIPFVEVAQPADAGITVKGLTYQDIVNTYATYTALLAAVATYGDLV